MNAFEIAKQRGIARLEAITASQIALPWATDTVAELRRSFFSDGEYWPYGVAANTTTLQTFLDYCYEQGVAARRMTPEEIFPQEAQFVLRV
jgi:4,5-dihydroxyphthalate decarboxylase